MIRFDLGPADARAPANDRFPGGPLTEGASRRRSRGDRPSPAAEAYLLRGLEQPGGKLPLFDRDGQPYSEDIIRDCLARGWAEPWFSNPTKPDWLICRITPPGRAALERGNRLRSSA